MTTSAGDEKVCNEIIYKLQRLGSLLSGVIESTQSIVLFLNTHTESTALPELSIDSNATFGANSTLLKSTLLNIDTVLARLHKKLEDDIDSDLFLDLESSHLEFSDRLHLLTYANDYSRPADIVAVFIFRYLPDILPLATAVGTGMISKVSIKPFITKALELTTDAVEDAAVNASGYEQLLKDVDNVLVSCASEALQFTSYVSQTLSVVKRILD